MYIYNYLLMYIGILHGVIVSPKFKTNRDISNTMLRPWQARGLPPAGGRARTSRLKFL